MNSLEKKVQRFKKDIRNSQVRKMIDFTRKRQMPPSQQEFCLQIFSMSLLEAVSHHKEDVISLELLKLSQIVYTFDILERFVAPFSQEILSHCIFITDKPECLLEVFLNILQNQNYCDRILSLASSIVCVFAKSLESQSRKSREIGGEVNRIFTYRDTALEMIILKGLPWQLLLSWRQAIICNMLEALQAILLLTNSSDAILFLTKTLHPNIFYLLLQVRKHQQAVLINSEHQDILEILVLSLCQKYSFQMYCLEDFELFNLEIMTKLLSGLRRGSKHEQAKSLNSLLLLVNLQIQLNPNYVRELLQAFEEMLQNQCLEYFELLNVLFARADHTLSIPFLEELVKVLLQDWVDSNTQKLDFKISLLNLLHNNIINAGGQMDARLVDKLFPEDRGGCCTVIDIMEWLRLAEKQTGIIMLCAFVGQIIKSWGISRISSYLDELCRHQEFEQVLVEEGFEVIFEEEY